MKTKAWMVVGLSLAVTLGASNESTTEARSTGFECNGCYGGVATFPVGPDTIEADAHEFDGNFCFPMDPDCWQCEPDDPEDCHQAAYAWTCYEAASDCYYDGEEEVALALAELFASANGLTDQRLAALIARYPMSVRVNVERGSVQIANCTGGVIGNIPVENLDAVVRLARSARNATN